MWRSIFERLTKEKKIKFKKEVPVTVTWHDPCHMGRMGRPYVPGKDLEGVYEEPRNILKAIPGVELVEMERIKEYAWCCGGGGGAFTAFKDFAQWTARERIDRGQGYGRFHDCHQLPLVRNQPAGRRHRHGRKNGDRGSLRPYDASTVRGDTAMTDKAKNDERHAADSESVSGCSRR